MEKTIQKWAKNSKYKSVRTFLAEFQKLDPPLSFVEVKCDESDSPFIVCGEHLVFEFAEDGEIMIELDYGGNVEARTATIHVDDLARVVNTVRAFMMTR